MNGYEIGWKDDRPTRTRHIRVLYQSWVQAAKKDENAWRLVDRHRRRPELELYDLESDSWEMDNLAVRPEYQANVAEMLQ